MVPNCYAHIFYAGLQQALFVLMLLGQLLYVLCKYLIYISYCLNNVKRIASVFIKQCKAIYFHRELLKLGGFAVVLFPKPSIRPQQLFNHNKLVGPY